MSFIRGFLKRYFPEKYEDVIDEEKYNSIPRYSEEICNKFNDAYNNCFKSIIQDNGTVVEQYSFECIEMGYPLYQWESKKRLFKHDIDGNKYLCMVENFKNNLGDTYKLITTYEGVILSFTYDINKEKNNIDFIVSEGMGSTTVYDDNGFEKTYSTPFSKNIYECCNIIEKIKNLKKDPKGFYLNAYSLFYKFSNE